MRRSWTWSWAVVALLGLLAACEGQECGPVTLEDMDRGRLTRDGLELVPDALPWVVVACDHEELPRDVVQEAMAWWNDQVGEDLFVGGVDQEELDRLEWLDVQDRPGVVTVNVEAILWEGWTVDDDDPNANGVAVLHSSPLGFITAADVVLDYEISYHLPTVRLTLIHELGHTLGLDDDEGPPTTVDLNSCMGSPTPPGCELTDQDLQLILDLL